jgi:glyoxylase-like metal-dependent hydrolase (beta-lactamase superfamily II)
MKFPYRMVAVAAALLSSPPTAAQFDDVDVSIEPLGGSVYVLQGAGGNLGASIGADGIILIDDQFAPLTPKILAALRSVSDAPVRFVINTHYHGDHVGGNENLGESGSLIIAHDNIRERMTVEQFSRFFDRATPPYPDAALPVVTFSDRVTLHVNGEPATVHHVAHAHTDGDAIVHFPRSNVIHMGDVFFNQRYPYVDLDAGGTIQGIIAGADLALSLASPDTKIIAGHGPAVATVQELREYRDYLAAARDQVQGLIDQGATLEAAIAAQPTAQWDATLGAAWITPAQFVTFIYNSLKGIGKYTPPAGE